MRRWRPLLRTEVRQGKSFMSLRWKINFTLRTREQ